MLIKLMRYLRLLHDAAKQDAAYERYMQSTVHDWHEGPLTRKERVRHWLYRFYAVHAALTLWYDLVHVLYCNRYGHDFEDSGSWANGNSGGEDLTCRRCGFHVRHVYY